MESRKTTASKWGYSVDSATVADDNDPHREYVPHEEVQETISKIQALKEAHTDVPSFLPAWADDSYFQRLYEERKGDKYRTDQNSNMSGLVMPQDVCGHRQDDVEFIVLGKENVRMQNIDKQKVKAFVYAIIENACKNLCGEETFAVQSRTVVSDKVRESCLHSNICKEEDHSIAYHANHKVLMRAALAELIQQTQDKTKRFRKSVLNPVTEKDYVARTTFLSQTFEAVHARDQVSCAQSEINRKGPTSAQFRFPQYTFLHTAGIPAAGSTRVLNKQRPSWKKRILGCFGL